MANKQAEQSDTKGDIDWDMVSYAISSQYRLTVLERLAEGPATPTRIASDTERHVANISRSIQRLRKRGQVELLVPEDRKKGRVYGLTEDGEQSWDVIQSQDLA